MALFGRSREVVLESGYRSKRSGVPRWLIWLISGVLIGVLGLLWVQDRYGPQRLTIEESRRIESERDEARSARAAAETRLDASSAELARVKAELDRHKAAASTVNDTIEHLRRELALFQEVIPPDPRGNPVSVRAARIERDSGGLSYHVLLTRQSGTDQPFDGIMQLVVSGQRGNDLQDTITLDPIPVRLERYQHLKGTQQLPKGFDPRQTSIHILDRPAGSRYGMRVINVQ